MKKLLVILLFMAIPCSAQVVLLSPLSEEFELKPGAKATGNLNIKNKDENVAVEVQIRQADYFTSADGTCRFPAPGISTRSNASWIDLPTLFTIPAGEKATIPYAIKVPRTKLEGSYWSVLLISAKKAPEATRDSPIGIAIKLEYAVQIITHVGNGTADLEFLCTRLKEDFLIVDVANTGTRTLRPQLILEINKNGKAIKEIIGKSHISHPGCSVRYSTQLELMPGNYEISVILSAGGQLWGRKLSLRF